MSTARSLVVIALAATSLTACGNSGPTHLGSDGSATLNVRQKTLPGAVYIEGAYSYVRMEQEGRKILEQRLSSDTRTPRATLTLDPGSYTMVSFQRPCDGNCGTLDPPADQCSLAIEALAGSVIKTTVRLSPGKGCTITKDG